MSNAKKEDMVVSGKNDVNLGKALVKFEDTEGGLKCVDMGKMFHRIFDEFGSIFDSTIADFGLTPFRGIESANFIPSLDVRRNKDGFKVTLETAGMDKNDLDVELLENRLTIKGNKLRRNVEEKDEVVSEERVWGMFERSVELPDAEILYDKVKSEYKDGVLTITIPTKEDVTKIKKLMKVAVD